MKKKNFYQTDSHMGTNFELTDDTDDTVSKKNYVQVLKLWSRETTSTLRRRFSHKCEESVLANFLDNLYCAILNCPLKTFALFLISMSVSSLLLNFIAKFNGPAFFTDINTISTIIIFLIGLLFLTSKRNVGELFNGSLFFSQFAIVYSQGTDFLCGNREIIYLFNSSSSVFVGMILGIVSLIFPSSMLMLLAASLLYSVLIYNRPECGILLTVFLLPFVSNTAVLMLSFITFVSFIIKYLRGKRHIDFGIMQAIMIITMFIFVIKGLYTLSGNVDLKSVLSYVSFILVCLITINLVRATSMLNKSIMLIVSVSRIYITLFLCYYIGCIFFGLSKASVFLESISLPGLYSAITQRNYFASIIAIAVPLNFAVMISSKNAAGFIKNVIYFVVMLVSAMFISSYTYTLVLLLSCVLVLSFLKKRFILFALPCPLLSYAVIKLYSVLPDAYMISPLVGTPNIGKAFYKLISDNLLFGIGLGENNYINSVSIYAGIDPNNVGTVSSTLLKTVLSIGLIGTIFVLIIVFFKLTKMAEFIAKTDAYGSSKVKILCIGLFASVLSLVVCCFFMNLLSDFRIAFLFAVILSLGYATQQCIDADYVDLTTVREYKQF